MENKTELMQLRHPDYDRELAELVRSNLSPKAFREKLLDYHENDIAAALEALTLPERQRIYHALDAAELSAVLEYAEPMTAYLNELSLRRRVNVLSRMDADAAVDYLKTLESGEKNTLVELMDEPKRREIARLWVYGEDEIGSIMTTNCIVIPEGLSVKAAMHQLVEQAAEHDNISTIYVVDSDNAFYGAIDLKDLIIAREGDPLAELIATSYPYVYAHERIEDALPRIQDYSEDSIPVLDEENRMLGVVTAQSLIQTVDDALSEDYARLAGLSAEEDLRSRRACASVCRGCSCCWGSGWSCRASSAFLRVSWRSSRSSCASSRSCWIWRATSARSRSPSRSACSWTAKRPAHRSGSLSGRRRASDL